jgi:hypothetical protein
MFIGVLESLVELRQKHLGQVGIVSGFVFNPDRNVVFSADRRRNGRALLGGGSAGRLGHDCGRSWHLSNRIVRAAKQW